MKEIKLYKSRWKAIQFLLISSIIVIGGIWFILYPGSPQWIGWILCFFGLGGYPIGLFDLFDRRPKIIINEIGICYPRNNNQDFIINWEVIQNAYLYTIHRQKFIGLQVDEAYYSSLKLSRLANNCSKINKLLGFPHLTISLLGIKIDEIKLTHFINAMSRIDGKQKAKRINMIERYLTNNTIKVLH